MVWDVRLGCIQWLWNPGFGSLKVGDNDTVRSGMHDFLLTFDRSSWPISHDFQDKGLCYSSMRVIWSKADADKLARHLRSSFSVTIHSAIPLLGIVSYECAIVSLCLRRAAVQVYDFTNVVTLKIRLEVTRGHSQWYRSIPSVCIFLVKCRLLVVNQSSYVTVSFTVT